MRILYEYEVIVSLHEDSIFEGDNGCKKSSVEPICRILVDLVRNVDV